MFNANISTVNAFGLAAFGLFIVVVIAWAIIEKILEDRRLARLGEEHAARHRHGAEQRRAAHTALAASQAFDNMESAARAARTVN